MVSFLFVGTLLILAFLSTRVDDNVGIIWVGLLMEE